MVDATHHLLVIDDEPHIGRIVRMQFERGPYQVSLAHDARTGLEFLAAHADVDCVLVDLNMPGMSGVDFLGIVRKDPRYAAIPMIVLTAAGQIGQVETGPRVWRRRDRHQAVLPQEAVPSYRQAARR